MVETGRRLRPGISLQSRITAVAMLTAVAVLLAACAAFIVEQWRAEWRTLVDRQATITRLLAGGDTIKPGFLNPSMAPRIAARMARSQSPESAAFLIDAQGRIIGAAREPTPEAAAAKGMLIARRPTRIDGRVVGYLVTAVPPPTLAAILPRYLALAGALFFAAMGLSLFLGRWLAARVTRPVERLSVAMHDISVSGDFSKKVERGFDDELGRLTDAFNELITELHANDVQLRRTMVELMDARDAAEAANKLKSQFLANMSHEIRTPLNGLLAMTQVMALERLDPTQRDRLEVIRTSGEALLSILNDVLDVSKIEAGKLELEIEAFDTEAVVRNAFAAFTAVAEKKGLTLALEIEDGARGLRLGDAMRLGQVTANLISNALKFTSEGGVRVTLRGDGEELKIEVADTGIGIAPEVVPLLFQKFTQADASTTRRFGGTGLGLAICHDLLQLMGGRIWVESAPGRGSVFHVEAPVRRVGEAPPAPEPVAAPEADAARERPLRVLAAEDNATNQLVLRTVLEIFGVELSLVDNGRLAVEAWRSGGYDLILMDIQMPEMDGLSATRAIRAAEAAEGRDRIPIIALSAHAMTHQVQEYLDAGIDLHVPKPIELPRLQAALDQAMSLGAGGQSAAAA
jgi:signal transduction histidine kinase/ActR/RegA family two-component response regulator